jgi:signal transduction histidine kinase
LDNACRYRKVVPVQVTLGPLAEQRTRIEVFNDGPPISEGNRTRLFQRFFTTERDAGGTGLGLAIVKAVADARHGSVEVESNEQGTRFVVVL